jgi:hypothetical protein
VTATENIISSALVLLAPICLVYCWYFYIKHMPWRSLGWRGRVTLGSLVLLSFAIVLWPIDRMTMPAANWGSGVGVGAQMRWAEAGERVASKVLLVAFVLSLFGRPRLILPLVLGCVGTEAFWIFSNMP